MASAELALFQTGQLQANRLVYGVALVAPGRGRCCQVIHRSSSPFVAESGTIGLGTKASICLKEINIKFNQFCVYFTNYSVFAYYPKVVFSKKC
jgi:hypothetical protein